MTWGPWQILLVLAIILILFGGKKLPELAHSLGKSLNEFKKGKNEGENESAPQPAAPQGAVPQSVAPQVTQQTASAAPTAAESVTPEVVK